jgi:hypothetical protein
MSWTPVTPQDKPMREIKEYDQGGAAETPTPETAPPFGALPGITAEDIRPKRGPKPKKEVAVVDLVNQPPHYTSGGIETIDFIEAKLTPQEYQGYLKGNVLKYASRLGHKGDAVIDAGKLNWYTTRLAQHLKGD